MTIFVQGRNAPSSPLNRFHGAGLGRWSSAWLRHVAEILPRSGVMLSGKERKRDRRVAEIVTVVDPDLPGFGDVADAFNNREDVWND